MRSEGIIAMLSLTLLAGCVTPDPVSESLDPGFGEVTRRNAAAQIIDPDPANPAGSAQPGELGVQGAQAIKRLRNGETLDQHNAEAKTGIQVNTSQGSGGPK